MGKKSVNAIDLVKDIRAGMNNKAIMEKHRIQTEKKLESFFNKLVAAGYLKQTEINNRFGKITEDNNVLNNDDLVCSNCGDKSLKYDDYFKEYTCENCGQTNKDLTKEDSNYNVNEVICGNCGKTKFIYNDTYKLYECGNCGETVNDVVQKILEERVIKAAGGEEAFRKKKRIMKARKLIAIILTLFGGFGLFGNQIKPFLGHNDSVYNAGLIATLLGGIVGLYFFYRAVAGPQDLYNLKDEKNLYGKKTQIDKNEKSDIVEEESSVLIEVGKNNRIKSLVCPNCQKKVSISQGWETSMITAAFFFVIGLVVFFKKESIEGANIGMAINFTICSIAIAGGIYQTKKFNPVIKEKCLSCKTNFSLEFKKKPTGISKWIMKSTENHGENEKEYNKLKMLVNCPNCKVELELDEKEQLEKKYSCPECNKLIDMN